MAKRHQYKASGKKTRTGQHRKDRHKTGQFLNWLAGQSNKKKPKKARPPKAKKVRKVREEKVILGWHPDTGDPVYADP